MLRSKNGIFDEGSLSLLSLETIKALELGTGRSLDVQRFRPNLVMRTLSGQPFLEESWLGGLLEFAGGLRMRVNRRVPRCVMVNLEPDSAQSDPLVLKYITI